MASVNSLIVLVSLVGLGASVFTTARLMEPLQDIYLGVITDGKRILRLTLYSTFFMCMAFYFFLLALLLLAEPWHLITARQYLSLLCLPGAIFPIAILRAYWAYFSTGKFRTWLFGRLRRRGDDTGHRE